MKSSNLLFFYFNVFALIVLIILIYRSSFHPSLDGMEYKDFISIILTALAALLAAVTIIIALVGAWGYNSIRDNATRVAESVAAQTAENVAARTAKEVAEIIATRVAETTARHTAAENPAADDREESALVAALTRADGKEDNGGSDGPKPD